MKKALVPTAILCTAVCIGVHTQANKAEEPVPTPEPISIETAATPTPAPTPEAEIEVDKHLISLASIWHYYLEIFTTQYYQVEL